MKKSTNILFLGPAPGPGWSSGDVPLSGRVGNKLARLLGVSREQFLASFDTANILNEHPGRAKKGDNFPLKKAKRAVNLMDFSDYNLVIMLGRGVQSALNFEGLRWFEERRRGGTTFVAFPHPSGVNHWWNDPENEARAKRCLRAKLL